MVSEMAPTLFDLCLSSTEKNGFREGSIGCFVRAPVHSVSQLLFVLSLLPFTKIKILTETQSKGKCVVQSLRVSSEPLLTSKKSNNAKNTSQLMDCVFVVCAYFASKQAPNVCVDSECLDNIRLFKIRFCC